MVSYLKRELLNHIYVERTDGVIKRYQAADFRPYFMARDLAVEFAGTIRHKALGGMKSRMKFKAEMTATKAVRIWNHRAIWGLASKTKRNYQQIVPKKLHPQLETQPKYGMRCIFRPRMHGHEV